MDPRVVRLRVALDDAEWQHLQRLTQGDRLPFDEADRIDALIADADDQAIELLAKCESILQEAPEQPNVDAERREDMLVYSFDPDAAELAHFLGSLRRNGFNASTVEGEQATVHIWIGAATDQEFFHLKETVRSLYEFTRVSRGRNPKGWRLHAP
ncbi:MAG: hypothetical protein M0Z66_03585 [Thermaerobacter sp.]|nr:hypothetical protein [Thermaerobacter sp.]